LGKDKTEKRDKIREAIGTALDATFLYENPGLV
jgi:hypothetical protein